MHSNSFDVVIAGAGISGLAAAHFLNKANPGLSILILEKSDRPGGAIKSMKENGYLAEWGAHGFLDNVEENRELLSDYDFEQKMQKASLKQFERYICLKGKLIRIPQSPPAIIKSDLMSFPAKLRVLADLWKKPKFAEQTVAEWAAYRFGKAILPFADIAITGTFAGDISTLSVDAAYPGMRRLEKENGSVFRGAIKSRKKKSSSGLPSMVSFKDGMEFLVKKIAENKPIQFNSGLTALERVENHWQLQTDSGNVQCKQLILALPINQALPILGVLEVPPANKVNEAIVTNIVVGFDSPTDIPFGFGYLAPKSEHRFALGTLFSSHMFPVRAPENNSLIEILIGGRRNPEYLDYDDDELIAKALADVSSLIDLPEKPVFTKVIRPSSGIPQLDMGHLDLIRYKDSLQYNYEGLHICGFGWEGIGINDMIKQAKKVAIAASLGEKVEKEQAKAKPIYF